MTERDEFLEALNSCELTSAQLLRALDAHSPDSAALVALRGDQAERLATVLPAELGPGDLERLKAVFNVGQEVWLKALTEKLAATRNLASLRRALEVARQLAATRAPRQSAIDCVG